MGRQGRELLMDSGRREVVTVYTQSYSVHTQLQCTPTVTVDSEHCNYSVHLQLQSTVYTVTTVYTYSYSAQFTL